MAEGSCANAMIHHLQDAVNRKPAANGLAIIVANERSVKWPEHKYLPGVRKDFETMKRTFEKLKFATLPILNPSRDELTQVILAAVSTQVQYPKTPDPQAYGRLVFYFSGHGDQKYIYTHDGVVDLQSEVFTPFLPGTSPHLAKIPKLFFIDACRGSGTDKGVRIRVCPPEHFRARGGGGEERVTTIGNYLLACSTQPDMKAFENHEGGFWTQEIARQLCDPNNIELSVHDVLSKVNKSLIDQMTDHLSLQQPVLESTLIGDPIRLLKEAKHIESNPETECYFTDKQHHILGSGCYVQNDPESQLEQQERQFYQLQATSAPQMIPQSYVASQGSVWPSAPPQQVSVHGVNTAEQAFIDLAAQHFVNGMGPSSMQNHAHYSQGDVTHNGGLFPVNSSSGNPILYQTAAVPMNMTHYGVDNHYAHNIMVPVSQPSDYQRYSSDPHDTLQNVVGQGTAGYQRHYSEPNIQHHIPSQASLQGGNEQGYYRGLLNHFNQTGVISDYHDQGFRENCSGGRLLYQSLLSLKHVATQKQINVVSLYKPSKSEAKEDAASEAYEQVDALETQGQRQQGRGGSDRDSSNRAAGPSITVPRTPQSSASQPLSSAKKESPTAKVWKKQLKEYFDKKLKGTAVTSIRYESKENQKGGRFTAIVYCPEIGMAKGERECPSKSAAEHSAAYNALKKLNALPK